MNTEKEKCNNKRKSKEREGGWRKESEDIGDGRPEEKERKKAWNWILRRKQ